ncbi:MAG: S41 family peptidase [Patescibacteria group bacterium]|nr:S41 family peptidase [Patescibacteria group bacterium]
MKIKNIPKSLKNFILFLVIFALGVGFGYKYIGTTQNKPFINTEKNTSNAFVLEIYDKIKENYWDNISDAQLLDLFKLAIDRNGGNVTVPKFENKDKLLSTINSSVASLNEDQRNKFTVNVVSQVLASLSPNGRSGLYNQKNEEQLKNTVSNINPEKDLYKDLGAQKGASEAAIVQAFQQKADALKNDNTPQAQEKLKQLAYAKDVLTNKDQKVKYDQNKVEPTIFTKIVDSGILYLQFKKFAPTSLEEFQKAFDAYKDDSSLNALIFDLRGNIGGAIDQTAYLLGFFLGKGQYAFDFYHKGEYLPFKTQADKLFSVTKYKQVVVLVDQNTQSSAEMMAASLKKYHAGVIVGVPTKGWGTVERIFPLDNQISKSEKYSLFLVHSITLRDDNQPIEGRGVEPDVSTKDPNWTQKLLLYFNNLTLVNNTAKTLIGSFSN